MQEREIGEIVGIYGKQGETIRGKIVHKFKLENQMIISGHDTWKYVVMVDVPPIGEYFEVRENWGITNAPSEEPAPILFNFKTRVTLDNVPVEVFASDEEKAVEKFKKGDWLYADYDAGERQEGWFDTWEIVRE